MPYSIPKLVVEPIVKPIVKPPIVKPIVKPIVMECKVGHASEPITIELASLESFSTGQA